jgi:hypothetical protein
MYLIVVTNDGLVTNDEEVRELMWDSEAWRCKNKEVDSSKREESKIRRVKTRSAIAVV